MAAPRRFFSRRIPVFYNVALLVLCVVFFLLPFALRGARMAVSEMQNNVADWLPDDYEETIDLGEFRKYFVGDQFVVISGPWCKENNPTYINLKRKIFEESLEYEKILRQQKDSEEIIRAHKKGDELGLMVSGDLHETWGQYSERWLKGKDQKWYWINRNGDLFRWKGQNNVIEGGKRFLERMVEGRNKAEGDFVGHFGRKPDDINGEPNIFYQNPELLCARPFKSVISGPDALEQMAGPGGTLRIGDSSDEELSAFNAKVEAHKRLSGALFGPTPADSFQWTFDSLLNHVDDNSLVEKLKSPQAGYREKFDEFMSQELKSKFDGSRDQLLAATEHERLEMWLEMWDKMGLEAPPRQTCLVVTINDPFLEELDRIVGRDFMGKPRGRIYELATGKCGLAMSNVHLGGPPSDNVAIDEEGTSTLLRLASLSGIIGILLAYYSFRSFRVTTMIFFIGGVSAIASLSYVWYFGSRLDAILMTMPSLIYVLAMSGAVHLINYYRDACEEFGHKRAVDIAVSHGWFPCFLASFTTALGLFSLCTSNLTPIYKFGFFSAIATLATLFFLYTYLPAALTIWPPPYRKRDVTATKPSDGVASVINNFWDGVFKHTTRAPLAVFCFGLALMIVFTFGVAKIRTTVQLLKLFDDDAKVLKDYEWMESNLGKLVPMEIVVNVDEKSQLEKVQGDNGAAVEFNNEGDATPVAVKTIDRETGLKYSFLERMEISHRIRQQLERFFGPDGCDIVGAGMSTDVFVPMNAIEGSQEDGPYVSSHRKIFNKQLVKQRSSMLEQDYMALTDSATLTSDMETVYSKDPNYGNRELWRISLRLAALEDVNYGDFVTDLKMVVEPILSAYRSRTQILSRLYGRDDFYTEKGSRIKNDLIVLLGRNPTNLEKNASLAIKDVTKIRESIDQDYLFSATLRDLLLNRDLKRQLWIEPERYNAENPFPEDEAWAKLLSDATCVVMIEDDKLFDKAFIEQHAKMLVDCREHKYANDAMKMPFATSNTAMNLKSSGRNEIDVTATYTGIVPIVYKAQGALLKSLIESIVMSFAMISLVMMVLLRDWSSPLTFRNILNVPGGLISMVPNVFPLIMIFGAMGFMGIKVDIGSMMTASVAMGIAVDDTIHFLTWYRDGLARGQSRWSAIGLAYSRCASAMTQTTLIAGLGLSVFALSTFQPTQRFGVLMLVLLAAALIGDLILLPAMLASPLGRFFGKERVDGNDHSLTGDDGPEIVTSENVSLRVVNGETISSSKANADENVKRQVQ
ncbi:MAG: MMPL family transporter [Pirellulaceae bacterium]